MELTGPTGVLLDHAQDLILLLDDDGQIRFINDACRRILGYEREALVGVNAFDKIHPDDEPAARAAFEETIADESYAETTVEHRTEASDGSWVWLESRMSNLNGVLDGFVISSRDVTNRVAAQRDHEESETRLEQLAATTGDVLWMFNSDWTELLFLNPAFETVYGRPVSTVEDDPGAFTDPVHPEDVPLVEAGMERLSAGKSVDMEYRVNPDEDYGVWVWVQAEPILVDDEVIRITGFSRDVSDRRRRQRQLIVMDNLLRHNLRNDLNAIMGNAELIEAELPEAGDRTAVIRRIGEDLLATAEKQREIIDLLTADETRTVVDVTDTVATAMDTVQERFPTADIELTALDGISANARSELGVAIVELLENAVRHSERERPQVEIDAGCEDGRAWVTIVDDAPAMPAIESQVLTGEEEMTDIYHSSGLGLWLVYWIVELSKGEITVESAPARGNLVRLTLPGAPSGRCTS